MVNKIIFVGLYHTHPRIVKLLTSSHTPTAITDNTVIL